MSKPIPTDLPMHTFATVVDFDTFMEENHDSLEAFYLKLAKKSSGITSITAEEAVEVGLCHGWIDGWGRGIDDKWYMKRYTPRRAKSIWSQKNVATVARLSEAGRMRPAGLAAVEAAKKDGRWERAYAGPATIEVPDDFSVVLQSDERALEFFGSLNKGQRYSVLWRIQTASPTARAGRIQAMLDLLSQRELPSQLGGKPTSRSGKKKRDSDTNVDAGPVHKATKYKQSAKPEGEIIAMPTRKSIRLASSKKS